MKTYKDLRVEFIFWSILYLIGWSVLIPLFFKLLGNELRWGTFAWDFDHIFTILFWIWCFGSNTYQLVKLGIKTKRAKSQNE